MALILTPIWTAETPSLGLAYIASALQQAGHEPRIFDYNLVTRALLAELHVSGECVTDVDHSKYFVSDLLFRAYVLPVLEPTLEKLVSELLAWNPEVLGFSIYWRSFLCAREIAARCKQRNPSLKIIYGGASISAMNVAQVETELSHGILDAAVMGEGEATVVELLERWKLGQPLSGCRGISYLSEGRIVHEEARPGLSLSDIPKPDFSLFPLGRYAMNGLPIVMSRGCVAKCTFCSETRYWLKYRYRSAEDIFTELSEHAERFGITSFWFNDSLVNGNFDVLAKLTALMAGSKHKFNWHGFARIDKRMTKPLLAQMARSGCSYLKFGLETGSQRVMDLMQKRTTVECAQQVIRDCAEAGIQVKLQVIVGFPGEEDEDFQATKDFLAESSSYITAVYPTEMMLMPGLPVTDDPERYHISTSVPHFGHHWETVDKKNNPQKRRERFLAIQEMIRTYRWEQYSMT